MTICPKSYSCFSSIFYFSVGYDKKMLLQKLLSRDGTKGKSHLKHD